MFVVKKEVSLDFILNNNINNNNKISFIRGFNDHDIINVILTKAALNY